MEEDETQIVQGQDEKTKRDNAKSQWEDKVQPPGRDIQQGPATICGFIPDKNDRCIGEHGADTGCKKIQQGLEPGLVLFRQHVRDDINGYVDPSVEQFEILSPGVLEIPNWPDFSIGSLDFSI